MFVIQARLLVRRKDAQFYKCNKIRYYVKQSKQNKHLAAKQLSKKSRQLQTSSANDSHTVSYHLWKTENQLSTGNPAASQSVVRCLT